MVGNRIEVACTSPFAIGVLLRPDNSIEVQVDGETWQTPQEPGLAEQNADLTPQEQISADNNGSIRNT